jgi:hypothetical protein
MDLEDTRGFWIGLGIALVLAALFVPIMIGSSHDVESRAAIQRECIKEHGNWDARNDQCTFNSTK